MDNVTHTLIGVAVTGAAVKCIPGLGRSSSARRAAFWTAVIGSNFPDLDFLVRPLSEDGNLAYLIHHRGHTHTFLFAVPIAAVSALLGKAVGRAKEVRWSGLFWLGLIAACLHIGADYLNNYGVHPWFPFSNRWHYGDLAFIIEPMLWFCLLPLAWMGAANRWSRAGWIGLEGLMLVLIWVVPFVPKGVALVLSIWAAAFAWLQWRRRSDLWLPWGGVAFTLLVLGMASWNVNRLIQPAIEKNLSEGERVVEVAKTPAPGNPACWSLMVSTLDSYGNFRIVKGAASLFPSIFPPASCSARAEGQPTAPLQDSGWKSNDEVAWKKEFFRPISELRSAAENFCRLKPFLSFARFPFWLPSEEGLIAGDLRYDRSPALEFTEFKFSKEDECFVGIPPWESRGMELIR